MTEGDCLHRSVRVGGGIMRRVSTLCLALALGGLTIVGGVLLVISAGVGLTAVSGAYSRGNNLAALAMVFPWLAFVWMEFAIARKTLSTLRLWRQRPETR